MSYLRLQDYIKTIQLENLNQITNFDPNIRLDAEQNTQEEITSYLTQKFDLVEEFTDIEVYNPSSYYNAGITLELNGSAWVSSQTYSVDEVVLYNNNIYQSIENSSGHTPGQFYNIYTDYSVSGITTDNSGNTAVTYTTGTTITQGNSWSLLGPQYKLYHTLLPYEYWDYDQFYNTGDKVYWRGKVYTCLISGNGYIPDNKTRKKHLNPEFGMVNYNTTIGTLYWGTGETYKVNPFSLLDTNYIKPGDFRSQQMIQKYVDITLYHIHRRIAPKNVPDVRAIAYDAAIEWLKGCAAGDITPNLRVKTYRSGGSFWLSSITKNNNNY